ncbi:hypothetical protein HDU91_000979, partial [Kappamyces sp. JEL0680]
MDFSVSPAESFWAHCNGGHNSRLQIPRDKSHWLKRHEVDQSAKDAVSQIFSELKNGTDYNLVAEVYLSGLDLAAIESAGLEPIQDLLDGIQSLSTTEDIIRFLAKLQLESSEALRLSPLLVCGVFPDMKNSQFDALYVGQSGFLGFPEKAYFFDEDKENIRAAFLKYLTKLATLVGLEDPESQARSAMEFEKAVARFAINSVEMRDMQAGYNPRFIKDLTKHESLWKIYMEVLGFDAERPVIIQRVDYTDSLFALLEETDIQVVKVFFQLSVLSACAPFLGSAFSEAHFDFFKKTLTGVTAPEERAKLVSSVVSQSLPDELSKIYVKKHFSEAAKREIFELVQFLIEALKEKIAALEWMTEPVKKTALKKLAALRVKVGYPDKWKDYSMLHSTVSRAKPYVWNMRQVSRF